MYWHLSHRNSSVYFLGLDAELQRGWFYLVLSLCIFPSIYSPIHHSSIHPVTCFQVFSTYLNHLSHSPQFFLLKLDHWGKFSEASILPRTSIPRRPAGGQSWGWAAKVLLKKKKESLVLQLVWTHKVLPLFKELAHFHVSSPLFPQALWET